MAKPTRQELKVINAATALLDTPYPASNDIVYMPTNLVNITFPHSDPGSLPIWTRYNGHQIFSIRPAFSAGEMIGYPYGTIPRLLMRWLTTELKRNPDELNIHLGENLSLFMKDLGLNPRGGGKRGDIVRCKNQLQRFFRAIYTNEYIHEGDQKHGLDYTDIQIAPKGKLWWQYHGDEEIVFDGYIRLSEEAAAMFRNSPMPCDKRILYALKSSSFHLDFNDWLHLKTFKANLSGKPQRVPWRGLLKQFGGKFGKLDDITVSDVSNFRRRAKGSIQFILQLCTYLKVDYFDGGVIIHPAHLPLSIRKDLSK